MRRGGQARSSREGPMRVDRSGSDEIEMRGVLNLGYTVVFGLTAVQIESQTVELSFHHGRTIGGLHRVEGE
jgi:hypothetical protein